MRSPTNWGDTYAEDFDVIFPDLAKEHELLFYPFFLEGVAANRELNQADGMHPTAAGVDIIVKNILPTVEAFLKDRAGVAAAQ